MITTILYYNYVYILDWPSGHIHILYYIHIHILLYMYTNVYSITTAETNSISLGNTQFLSTMATVPQTI